MWETFKAFCAERDMMLLGKEPMSKHTSFKIGGPADFYALPSTVDDLQALLQKAAELSIPYTVIGNGSNLLVSDRGVEGVVICLTGLKGITVSEQEITCGAGVLLSTLCMEALEHSLSGLEFAYGIPGTVGGALFMNAGAYGGEMRQVVSRATVLFPDGRRQVFLQEEMAFNYRKSVFQENGAIILDVTFLLVPGDKTEIKAHMETLLGKRKEKQPLEYPSAGSTFKRPEGYYAGALIEKNGLKGLRRGGAMVSEKHAGFVINAGGASCADVLAVMKEVQQTVWRQDGVMLEPEVLLIGRKE